MGSARIPDNGIWAPFLGDQGSIINGLDQLGLQGVPEATFQKLLHGLNNVTGRIRYYAFYCWLLDQYMEGVGGQYAEKGASEDPALQKRFIRAGEFIMSLIGQHPDLQLTNIPGSTFAQKLWEDDPKGPFDLGAAIYNAEGGTNNSYWKYSSGAFGQYYLGSMRDMRLVQLSAEDTQLFLRTPKEEGATWVSGKELAEAFAESVGEKAEALFIQAIRDEQISREVLDEVSGRFRPDGIPKGSLEHDLLSRMLGQADDPLQAGLEGESRLRASTIRLFLSKQEDMQGDAVGFWKEPYRRFTALAYLEGAKLEEENSGAWFGWYHYMFNELWQFSCNALLSVMLRSLRDDWHGMARKEAWVNQLASHVEQRLLSESGASQLTLNAAITAHDAQQEWDYVGQIFNRASTVEATAVAAVRLILTLVNRNADSFERLQDFDGRVIQKADQSPVRKLEHLIAEFGERPIQKFIAHFMDRHIVMRHHEVAIRKMRGRSQSTQKFSFESGWVRYLRPMEAAFMGPRLPSLQHFLADLGLTQTDGVPTALASEWMDKHLVT